ncbi:hypothetical protein FA15DRAFT_675936, partial [Coprinopsis marcescibilis]
ALASAFEQQRVAFVSLNIQAGVGTVLVVDYIQTLPSELHYLWTAPWSPIKVLYILARYSAFISAAIIIRFTGSEGQGFSLETCRGYFYAGCMSILVTVAFSEALLFIRVYALSGRSKVTLAWLIVQFILVHGAQFTLMGVAITGVEFTVLPDPLGTVFGCASTSTADFGVILSILFATFVFSGVVLTALTAWFGFRKFRHSQATNLVTVFFRDGLIYFALITGTAIANIVVSVSGVDSSNFIMGESQGVFHSILACRLVLHLRETGNKSLIESENRPRPV